jgi:hypothetical protein
MRVRIRRRVGSERASWFGRKRLTYTISLSVTLSDEELAAIEQKRLQYRIVWERPFHERWGLAEAEWPEMAGLPIGLLVDLHVRQYEADVGYFSDEFAADIGDAKLREGLAKLKEMIQNAKPSDRIEEFEY